MIRFICFALGLLLSDSALAQQVAYDGIYLKSSPINESTFYFGEPIYLHFDISNQKDVLNLYYIPQAYTNTQIELRDRETNQIVGEVGWRGVSHRRDEWRGKPPSENYAFQPQESLIFQVFLNDEFGSVKLTEPEYYNALADRLKTLPVGKYKLTFKYFLFPSSEALVSRANFEVLEVPTAVQDAFNQYVKTTTYACNAHYFGENNYTQSHPDSYENFLRQYNDSPYSQYAFVDMVTQIYYRKGMPENLQNQHFKSYYEFFPKITNNNFKFYYAVYLPMVVQHTPGQQTKESLDKFLREQLVDEHPDLSEALIQAAKFYTKVEGLKNYAKTAIPR